MEIRNIRTGETVGIAILLTALFCWGCRDNRPLINGTIHEAAANGNLTDVKRHLQRGAALNAKDAKGATPLLWAAQEDYMDVAELLIAKGAAVNAKDDDGRTPLGAASVRSMVRLLRKHGARE